MSDPLLAKLLKDRGGQLVNQAVDTLVSGKADGRPSLSRKLAGAALMRIATRSVPGAILVGGGLLAKHLHDRHKQARARTITVANTGGTAAKKGA